MASAPVLQGSPFHQLQQILEIADQENEPTLFNNDNLPVVVKNLTSLEKQTLVLQHIKIAFIAIAVIATLVSLFSWQWSLGAILFRAILTSVPAWFAYETSIAEKAQIAVIEIAKSLKTSLRPLLVIRKIQNIRASIGSTSCKKKGVHTLSSSPPAKTPKYTPLLTFWAKNEKVQELYELKIQLDRNFLVPCIIKNLQEGFTLIPSQGQQVGGRAPEQILDSQKS